MGKLAFRLYLSFPLIICFFLLLINTPGSRADEDGSFKFAQHIGAPTLKFLYCYSCGYRKMFDEYANIIQQEYPEITIHGSNYDPPGMNMFLARLIGFAKMLIIVCILGGVDIFHYINQPQPTWWQWCIENRLYACMMLFFLCNIIEGQLIQSGAFEIFLNDVPVWSKLETGRIPQPAELFQIIKTNLRFVNHNTIELPNEFAK